MVVDVYLCFRIFVMVVMLFMGFVVRFGMGIKYVRVLVLCNVLIVLCGKCVVVLMLFDVGFMILLVSWVMCFISDIDVMFELVFDVVRGFVVVIIIY